MIEIWDRDPRRRWRRWLACPWCRNRHWYYWAADSRWLPLTPSRPISASFVIDGKRCCAVNCPANPRHAASHGDPSRALRRVPQVISSHSSRPLRPGKRAMLVDSTLYRLALDETSYPHESPFLARSGAASEIRRRRSRERSGERERRVLLSPKSPWCTVCILTARTSCLLLPFLVIPSRSVLLTLSLDTVEAFYSGIPPPSFQAARA